MGKILGWVVSLTGLGKVNDSIKGYRSQAVALATALAATTVIIVRFTEKGLPYLATLMGDPEFQTAAGAWTAFFLALKVARIESGVIGTVEPPK